MGVITNTPKKVFHVKLKGEFSFRIAVQIPII